MIYTSSNKALEIFKKLDRRAQKRALSRLCVCAKNKCACLFFFVLPSRWRHCCQPAAGGSPTRDNSDNSWRHGRRIKPNTTTTLTTSSGVGLPTSLLHCPGKALNSKKRTRSAGERGMSSMNLRYHIMICIRSSIIVCLWQLYVLYYTILYYYDTFVCGRRKNTFF